MEHPRHATKKARSVRAHLWHRVEEGHSVGEHLGREATKRPPLHGALGQRGRKQLYIKSTLCMGQRGREQLNSKHKGPLCRGREAESNYTWKPPVQGQRGNYRPPVQELPKLPLSPAPSPPAASCGIGGYGIPPYPKDTLRAGHHTVCTNYIKHCDLQLNMVYVAHNVPMNTKDSKVAVRVDISIWCQLDSRTC